MAKLRLLSSFTIPPMQSDFKETLQHSTPLSEIPPPINISSCQDNNEQDNEDLKGHITFTGYPLRQAD